MTDPNDTLDDETYESLIEELGLDLDIDEPIGQFEKDELHSSAGEADGSDILFQNDVDTSPRDDENGVEISADLLAELQSVIGGSELTPSEFNEEATFAEDPIQVSREVSDAKPVDLAAAMMGHVVKDEKTHDIEAVDLDDENDFDDLNDEEEVSVFDGLDLSEEALSREPDEFELDIEPETENEDEWVSDTASDKVSSSFSDLDSILENALSKDFEPPLDDADQYTDRLSQSNISSAPAPDFSELEVPDTSSTGADFEAFEEPENSPSSRSHSSPVETEMPAFEDDFDADDNHFSLEDFADDFGEEVSQSPETPTKAVQPSTVLPRSDLGLTSSAQNEEYIPSIETDAASMDDDDEDVDFALTHAEGGDRVIPRITIHAFCQTQMCQQMLNKSMQDRRMVNVTADIVEGGVVAAINYYQEHDLPHMIVVESTAKSAKLLAELDELAQLCDETVKVVVIGAANDIRLYRELMARGVSEYIVPPLETVQLIRAISSQFADPEQPFVGKTLAVTGVKGGVGSSTIAHNLAWAISERLKQATTLIDLDLNFGTTGLDFNSESNQTIADALMAPDRFDDAVMNRLLTQATDNLSLFTAPASLDRTYDVDEETYSTVLNKVRETVPFVVLDLPHIWTDWFKGTVVSADEIVVVVQPDLASLRNGKNLIDFLKAARPNDSKPRLVINQVGVPKRPEIPVKDFAQAMDLEPDLVLPFDPQLFGTAANNGQMIADVAEDSKCSQGIDYLASLVTGREIKVERGSLLNKLFKR